MGGRRAILCGILLGGLLALAGGPACAQHFGGGGFGGGGFPGFHFGGPRFDAPRFDGPAPHEAGPPLPHEPDPPPREPVAPPPPELAGARKCFNPAESRARVAQLQLRPPFEMMRRASNLAGAQALGGKLCRWADLEVYDISLLRADGRVVHVFLDASTGHEVNAPSHLH
ncbi:hypothetical protein CCR94_13195 [Rhodoblastus sphagnicola]|uniref:PepSY domain-containing protein n=1 Tax=Rhodoblastus sphagnicola TaxID=333368 RepID=A0A2S6N6N1_9HYPH|nr:PepSY domain-containing protein [Rhodoblastus sphagnicola]MBB4197620.1 hypothetical protein [Rhodoblastus sphagnicola]PPQ30272.1 hypothetical protein CCR94_13195 [Rhodoblastus sphagnicola]